jgi:2-methylisocitrate lyase-like PEP mutase family enzyme
MNLRERLRQDNAVHAPGAFDALSALLIEQAGFEAVYLSGASVAYTQLGQPDIGLLGLDHMLYVISRICDRITIPLIVDADTGYGNALNVQRTVRTFERNGAAAIQIEDQSFPKRCGHLAGKGLISAEEMAGKVKAAVDARHSDDTLIIARTDAIAVEGFAQALDRAELYLEAGADVLFIEAPSSLEEMQRIVGTFGGRVPLLANMVEGGKTPIQSRDDLSALGFRLVISPGALVRALMPAAESFLRVLKEEGSTASLRDRMTDLAGVNRRIGLEDMLSRGERYDPPAKPPKRAAE